MNAISEDGRGSDHRDYGQPSRPRLSDCSASSPFEGHGGANDGNPAPATVTASTARLFKRAVCVGLADLANADHPLSSAEEWVATVRQLWHKARYREERYVAIDLTGYPGYTPWQSATLLPLYEELIVTGAWWDFVDRSAIRRIGPILRADPVTVAPIMRAWACDADRWKRRTAIICQVGSTTHTDRELLSYCIEANIDASDVVLRKGIG